MYTLVLTVALFLVALVMYGVSRKWENSWTAGKTDVVLDNILNTAFYKAPCVVLLCVAIVLAGAAANISATNELVLIKLQEQRIALIYEAETQYHSATPDVGGENLVSRVAAFNTKILEARYWGRSGWVNLFVAPAYLEVEPIPYNTIKNNYRGDVQ